MNFRITLYLDTRRNPQNGKYNVRLRLYDTERKKTRFITTVFKFSKKDFKSIWETKTPRTEFKQDRKKLEKLLERAEKLASQLRPFSFDSFESAWKEKPGEKENVFIQYDAKVEQKKKNGQMGTADNYQYSKQSIINFLKDETGLEPEKLLFREITPVWLQQYENYMIEKGKSPTTIGIYLRPLRALFNEAIANNIVSHDIYPFGRRKYEIPHSNNTKRALNREQLKKLFEAEPATPEQKKAKDYFFFLYSCAGLNIKDLMYIKYSHLKDDKLIYIREKTKRTTKSHSKPVVVYLNQFAKDFIKEHGNDVKTPENYIFPICSQQMTEEQKYFQSKTFTRFINQHIKKLAEANGLPGDISTYWSRHTFATTAIRSGASLEQISQALNHNNLNTTKAYFAGFEDEAMKELTNNLMNF
jgi:site-specific recombinase XerD